LPAISIYWLEPRKWRRRRRRGTTGGVREREMETIDELAADVTVQTGPDRIGPDRFGSMSPSGQPAGLPLAWRGFAVGTFSGP